MMMKKILKVMLVLALAFSLVACGGKEETKSEDAVGVDSLKTEITEETTAPVKEEPSDIQEDGIGEERPSGIQDDGIGEERPSGIQDDGIGEERPSGIQDDGMGPDPDFGEGIGEVVALSEEELSYMLGQTTNTWLEMTAIEKDDLVVLIGRYLEETRGYIVEDYDDLIFMLDHQMEQYYRNSVDEGVLNTVCDILSID